MSNQHNPDDATKLRWFIDNRWGDAVAQPLAQELIDRIVGYPAPTRKNIPQEKGDEGAGAPAGSPDEGGSGGPSAAPVAARRVALIVGHNSVAKGAYADAPVSRFEYDFNAAVASEMLPLAPGRGIECRRFLRAASGGYNAEIDRVYRDVNAWGPDLAVEMHFNGGGGDYATMLHAAGSAKGAAAAEVMLREFSTRLGVRAWGLMPRSRADRGGRSVWAASAPCVLTEPFFGDNAAHARRVADYGTEGFARLYLDAVAAALRAIGK